MNKSMNKEYISPPFRSSDLSLSLLFFSFLFFSFPHSNEKMPMAQHCQSGVDGCCCCCCFWLDGPCCVALRCLALPCLGESWCCCRTTSCSRPRSCHSFLFLTVVAVHLSSYHLPSCCHPPSSIAQLTIAFAFILSLSLR
jgi:hypothetical protein